jgi:hypothetical protein
LVRFAMATGIGPLRLFPDIILYSPVKKQREKLLEQCRFHNL